VCGINFFLKNNSFVSEMLELYVYNGNNEYLFKNLSLNLGTESETVSY
jgi:hypothetical protein